MLHIFINIFVVSLGSYQLWRRKSFCVKSYVSNLINKLSSTCLRAMTRKSVKSTYFFHILWWESLLKTNCSYLCSVQALIRLQELPVWRIFIMISYCRGFCGELYQDKYTIHTLFLNAYLCFFSIIVIEQENPASMLIWFEIGLNHICNCFI